MFSRYDTAMGNMIHAGRCRFCGETFSRAGIARHTASCKARKELTDKGTSREYLHLIVTDTYYEEYWLDLFAAPEATLEDLDRFFRDIWVECCHHTSIFKAGNIFYTDVAEPYFHVQSKKTPLIELATVKNLKYIYDPGDPTRLEIRFLKPVLHGAKEKDGKNIIIAARNNPPKFICECGREAVVFCRSCLFVDEAEPFLCETCMKDHGCDSGELHPLTNSPRMGVCGYGGSENLFDREGEYPFFEEAGRLITGLPEMRDSVLLNRGTTEEKVLIVKKHVEILASLPVRNRHFKVARVIQHHPDLYAEAFTRILETAVAGSIKGYSHFFALFLSTLQPNEKAYTTLLPLFTAKGYNTNMWGHMLEEAGIIIPVFASLGRNNPQMLFETMMDSNYRTIFRGYALYALLTLYMYSYIPRTTIISYLHSATETTLKEENRPLGDLIAASCCLVYPDELIRDVQRLCRADLTAREKDHLEQVRRTLEKPMDRHLEQQRENGDFFLPEDFVDFLEEIFLDEGLLDEDQEQIEADFFQSIPRVPEAYVEDSHGTIQRKHEKVGRNDPCPCGSGKKYKKCCGR